MSGKQRVFLPLEPGKIGQKTKGPRRKPGAHRPRQTLTVESHGPTRTGGLYVLENWITNFRREMAIQDAVRKSVGKRYVGQMSSEGRPLLRFWVSLASAKDSSSPDIDSSSESNRSDGFGFSALSACATRLVRWLVTLDGVA